MGTTKQLPLGPNRVPKHQKSKLREVNNDQDTSREDSPYFQVWLMPYDFAPRFDWDTWCLLCLLINHGLH